MSGEIEHAEKKGEPISSSSSSLISSNPPTFITTSNSGVYDSKKSPPAYSLIDDGGDGVASLPSAGSGEDSSEEAVGDRIDGARRSAPLRVGGWNLVFAPKRNGARGAARRGRAGASAESMTRDGESSKRGREGTGGGGCAAGGRGGGGVRGRRVGSRFEDIPRSVSIEGGPAVGVGVVGVDGTSFSSSTGVRGLGLDGVDAGVDELEEGGLGKRSNVGLTTVSK